MLVWVLFLLIFTIFFGYIVCLPTWMLVRPPPLHTFTLSTAAMNNSTDEVESKELYHDAFREVDSPRVTMSSDEDVKDMSRMGKDQQFNVGCF